MEDSRNMYSTGVGVCVTGESDNSPIEVVCTPGEFDCASSEVGWARKMLYPLLHKLFVILTRLTVIVGRGPPRLTMLILPFWFLLRISNYRHYTGCILRRVRKRQSDGMKLPEVLYEV